MSAPRIFISHSAKESYAAEARDEIFAALLAAGFDPFVDVERLKPGEPWRNELYTRMYRSHGGVILFSENALISDWVVTEANILASRPTVDQTFKLLMVTLGAVGSDDLKAGKFSPLNLTEFQLVGGAEKTAKQIAEEVRDALAPLKYGQPPQNTFEKLEVQVGSILATIQPDVRDGVLKAAAEAMGVDIDIWEPAAPPYYRLAREMLRADLLTSTQAVISLMSHLRPPSLVEELVELIAPSWVNPCAARWIPSVARQKGRSRLLGMNSKNVEFTAFMFVRHACCRPPTLSWPVRPITASWSDSAVEDLKREVSATVKVALGMDVEESDKKMFILLNGREMLKEPLFIVVPPPVPPKEVFQEVVKDFPTVTFFLLTGERLPTGSEFDENVQVILPELQEGEEETAYMYYLTAKSILPKPQTTRVVGE